MLDYLSKLSAFQDYARYNLSSIFYNLRGESYSGIVRIESGEHTYPNGAKGEYHKIFIGTDHVHTIHN